ncbi:MAG: hypothetical protein LW808_004035 [Verrucomicrobiota bacterium]|nr:MAG: hypothetical protein LW808_004035 [Verrucomicrobiota bacterium]
MMGRRKKIVDETNEFEDEFIVRKRPKIPSDSWQVVPHRKLQHRKAAIYRDRKNSKETKIPPLTSLHSLSKTVPVPNVPKTQLKKRIGKQVNSVELSVSQLVKITLVDYNSVSYFQRAS